MSISRDRERKAFQLICEAGEEGLLQMEVWKRMGVSNKEGSRIARKFEEEGIIKRQKELREGRWTYRLTSLRKLLTLDSILDCPCIVCDDIDRCTPGGRISPSFCPKLTCWIELNTVSKMAKLLSARVA